MITALKTERIEDQRNRQAAYKETGTKVVGSDSALASLEAILFEVFEAQFSDVAHLTAITTGGFSGSDLAIEADIHSLNFRFMEASSVVSTRSWSGPPVNNFAANGDTHGVSGVDRFNAMPANADGLQGIGNDDSLIKDRHRGVDKEQVVRDEHEGTPGDRNQVTFEATVCNSLNDQSNHNDRRNASAQPDRAWSVAHHVTHLHSVILSQQSGLEGSQA